MKRVSTIMTTKIYYTVEKQTVTLKIEECNGWKDIKVYDIVNDIPKQWFEIEARNYDRSEDEIQAWLDNNGFDDREYDIIRL